MIVLYLLRHAHAGDSMKWSGDDSVRPLTTKGRRQCQGLGRLLAGLAEPPDLFIASPMARAQGTAEAVAEVLGATVVVDERLAWDVDVDAVRAILADAGHPARPCLVGHDPDLSELLAELLGVGSMPMRKATVACVVLPGREVLPGTGTLRFLVPPELLPSD
jgi:phosphohistidine phosphatase SixA